VPVPPLSRRSVLQLGGVTALALLGGCTGGDDGPATPGGKGAEPDPDLALLTTAIADKQDLLDTYDAALSAHPPLAARIRPLREDHAAHLAALTAIQEKKTGRPDLPTSEPSATGSPRPSSNPGPVVPTDRDQAVEALAKADLAAAGRRIGQCESARDPELARLLASIGGSEAAHTAVLRKT
jgi:hypothetical protein